MLILSVDPGQPLRFSQKGKPVGSIQAKKSTKRGGRGVRLKIDGFDGIDIARSDAKKQTSAGWEGPGWPEGNGNHARVGMGRTIGGTVSRHRIWVKGPDGEVMLNHEADGFAVEALGYLRLTLEQVHALAELAADLAQELAETSPPPATQTK